MAYGNYRNAIIRVSGKNVSFGKYTALKVSCLLFCKKNDVQAVFTTLKAGKFLSVGTVTGDFVMKATVQANEFNGGKMPAFGVESGGKLFKVVVGANPAEGKGRWPFVRIYSEGITEFCQADIDQVNDLSIDPDSDYEITVAFMGGKIFAQIANRFAIYEQSNIRHYLGWYDDADHWEDASALLNELFDASAQRKVGIATNFDDGLFKRVSLDTDTENVKKLFYIDNASAELAGKTFKYIDGAEAAAHERFTVSANMTATGYTCDNQPGFSVTTAGKMYVVTVGVDNADSAGEPEGKHRRSLDIGIYCGKEFYHQYAGELPTQLVVGTPYNYKLTYTNGVYILNVNGWTYSFGRATFGGDTASLFDLFDDSLAKTIGVGAGAMSALFTDIAFVKETEGEGSSLLVHEYRAIANAEVEAGKGFSVGATFKADGYVYKNMPGLTVTTNGKTYLITVGVDDWAEHKSMDVAIFDGLKLYGGYACELTDAVIAPNQAYDYSLTYKNGKYIIAIGRITYEFNNGTAMFTDVALADLFSDGYAKTIGIGAANIPAEINNVKFYKEPNVNVLLANENKAIDNATATGAFTVSAKVTATRLGYRYQPGFTITVGGKAYLLTVGVDDWAAHKDWELGIYDGENWYGKWYCTDSEAVLPYMEYEYKLVFDGAKYCVTVHDKYFEFDADTEFEKFGDSSVKYKLPAEMFDSSTPKTIGIAASGAPAIFKDITFSAS